MTALTITADAESWPLKTPVRIARQTYVAMDVVVVHVTDSKGITGRGEAAGLPYEGETIDGLLKQLWQVAPLITEKPGPEGLLSILPRGGARNALDCAMWDLRCKQDGKRIWELAGIGDAKPVATALTFGIAEETDLRRAIRNVRYMPIIKLKADRYNHIKLAQIAREEHPSVRLLIDANGSWDRALLDELASPLGRLGVELIEQPVAPGEDTTLQGYNGAVPLAADESCTDRSSLAALRGLYSFVNIKLDKTGGLTEAIALADAATEREFGLMVGNMGGTSLSMAAHMVVAQRCRYVDLDAPLLCRSDRKHALRFDGNMVSLPAPALWG